MEVLEKYSLKLSLVRESTKEIKRGKHIRHMDDALEILKFLRTSAEEKFVVLHLNSQHQIIGYQIVSHGTLSASLVHPREVFKAAIINNSYAIIAAHNHPSGSKLIPSNEDRDTTIQLIAAGKLLGINLLDHLILDPGEGSYSFREHEESLWR